MGICMGAASDGSVPSPITAEAPPRKHSVQSEPSGEREMDFRFSLANAPASFGSQKVLESCWSEEELEGRIPAAPDAGLRDAAKSGPPGAGIIPVSLPAIPFDLRLSVRSVQPFEKHKVVALTFDLCEAEREKSGYDAGIVNCLRAHGIPATFFAGGKWMRSHPVEAMQLMADPLFEIGNHSWNHRNLAILDDGAARDQVFRTQTQYAALREHLERLPCARRAGAQEMNRVPMVPRLFRFPYGRCTGDGLRVVGETGLTSIQWDVVSGDPSSHQTPERMATLVLKQMRPGSIAVFHANGRGWHTARALPRIIAGLQAQDYAFLTVSELLSAGVPNMSKECYEFKPGDNLRYDRPLERKWR